MINCPQTGPHGSLELGDQSAMERTTISTIFNEIIAGSDTEALLRRIATLPDDERCALLKGLRYVAAEALCDGPGQQIRLILNKFGDGRS